MPKDFFFRLTLLNVLSIAAIITLSGWALYHTACFLVEGMEAFDSQRQKQFNTILFHYLWIFSAIAIIIGSVIHFYFINKLMSPIKSLIISTKQLQQGKYPEPITKIPSHEIGELILQYNQLVEQWHSDHEYRKKLVSDISHEFRTPLANLQGYLHGLKTGVISGDQELFAALYKQTKRLSQMVEQFDQLKEIEQQPATPLKEWERVDISEEVRHSVSMFKWKLKKKGIPIVVKVESCKLSIDREKIQQVLTNLLDNALRYYKGKEKIVIHGQREKDYYRIVFQGPGEKISNQDQKYLFDRFYRVDPSRNQNSGGSGLGLAIAKELIEQHQGRIGVTVDGNINAFWFTLPYD